MQPDLAPFDRATLKARRARRAGEATAADFLLARAAEDILDRLAIVRRDFPRAVNLGAHHGLLSRRIRDLPNVGLVVDVDPVLPLLARCDGPCVAADEEALPFADHSLDLIVSALSLQFVNDLPGTLAQIRRALKPDGLLLAALVGGDTLPELRRAWLVAEEEMAGGVSPRVAPFIDVRDLGSLAQRAGLALPVVDRDVVDVTYDTPLGLMRDLKAMAAGNVLAARRRTPVTRGLLARACLAYEELYALPGGRIPATFEILTLTAWAPDASQPKPLRPGSATTRLADALGTTERSAGEKAGGQETSKPE